MPLRCTSSVISTCVRTCRGPHEILDEALLEGCFCLVRAPKKNQVFEIVLWIMIFVHMPFEVYALHHVQRCLGKAADETDGVEVFFTGVTLFPQTSEAIDYNALTHAQEQAW